MPSVNNSLAVSASSPLLPSCSFILQKLCYVYVYNICNIHHIYIYGSLYRLHSMYIYIYVDLYIDVMMYVKQDGQISIGGRVFGMNRVNQRPVRPQTPIKTEAEPRFPISTWLTSDCVTPIQMLGDQ